MSFATTSATRVVDPVPPWHRNPFASLFGGAAAYTSEDMTDNTIAVLDDLDCPSGHVSATRWRRRRPADRPAPFRPRPQCCVLCRPCGDLLRVEVTRYLRLGLLSRLARMKFPEGREATSPPALRCRGEWHLRPSRSTRTRHGSRSSAGSTAGRVAAIRRADRSAPSRTARDWWAGQANLSCTGTQPRTAGVGWARAPPPASPAGSSCGPASDTDIPEPLSPQVAREFRRLADGMTGQGATPTPAGTRGHAGHRAARRRRALGHVLRHASAGVDQCSPCVVSGPCLS